MIIPDPEIVYNQGDDASLEQGVMRVHFTNEMRVFDVFKSVNSKVDTLEIKSSEVFGNRSDLRMLQSDEIFGV